MLCGVRNIHTEDDVACLEIVVDKADQQMFEIV